MGTPLLLGSGTFVVPSPYDPDAQAFITATGISGTDATAINDLVLDLKAASIWTKFNALYPIIGGTATTHKYNLKNPLDTDAAFRLTFSTGWTHSSTGMTPSTAYADTFIIPSTHLSLNNTHLSYYSRTDIGANTHQMGCSQLTSEAQYLTLITRYAANTAYYAINVSQTNVSGTSVSNSDSRGFFIASRTASNVVTGFRNSTKQLSSTTTSSILPNTKIILGAINNYGSAAAYSTNQCAFSSIGTGLTDTEAQVFYQIVEKYQVALSRNINPTQSFYYNRNYNNETNAFLFATQITDTTQQTAVNTLVNDFKSAGIWTKMKAVYPIVGGTAATHAVNLSAPGTYNLTFSTGWTHSSTGITPNGTSAFANTSLNPTSAGIINTSTHISYYRRTRPGISYVQMGSIDASGNRLLLSPDYGASGFQNITEIVGASQVNRTQITSLGLICGNRPDSTLFKTIVNGSVSETIARTAVTQININLYIGAMNQGGSTVNYCNNECAFASIGTGLTDTEATNFYTAVQTFQTSLGRQIP